MDEPNLGDWITVEQHQLSTPSRMSITQIGKVWELVDDGFPWEAVVELIKARVVASRADEDAVLTLIGEPLGSRNWQPAAALIVSVNSYQVLAIKREHNRHCWQLIRKLH